MKNIGSKLRLIRRKLDCPVLRVQAILTVALLVTLFAGKSQLAEIARALSTTISISPDSQTILVEDSTSVDVRIDDVTNLHGAEVHLSFDSAILNVTGISEGPLLAGNGFTILNQYNNSAGTIDYARTLLNVPSVNGDGVLITITLKGMDLGTSSIAFIDALLSDRDGNVIPSSTSDGQITVTREVWPSGLFGDIDGDCDVDIVDIMQVACRWQTSCENPDPDNNPDTPNYDALCDVNNDCVIDIEDIMQVAAHWGDTC